MAWPTTSGKKFAAALRRKGWNVEEEADSLKATHPNGKVKRFPFNGDHILAPEDTRLWGPIGELEPDDLK